MTTDLSAARAVIVQMVVDASSNDFESYDAIVEQVSLWVKEENVVCDDCEISAAIADAVAQGLIDAFDFSVETQNFTRRASTNTSWTECYFLATPRGKALL